MNSARLRDEYAYAVSLTTNRQRFVESHFLRIPVRTEYRARMKEVMIGHRSADAIPLNRRLAYEIGRFVLTARKEGRFSSRHEDRQVTETAAANEF